MNLIFPFAFICLKHLYICFYYQDVFILAKACHVFKRLVYVNLRFC